MQSKRYSQSFLDELRAKNDIVSVISRYIKVEKKGKNYWACCPFHNEKTPSFAINEYDQYYHCFGCKESGDVITFVKKFEGVEYSDAIRILAGYAGMEVPQAEQSEAFLEKKQIKDKSLQILEKAKNIYKENLYLPEAKIAQEYIKKRGLTKKDLDKFELGYSLGYDDIVKKLKSFTPKELTDSGLCELNQRGQPYDAVALRLTFPIINTFGECIGFSARDLQGNALAKYKNTSATLLFDKSRTVYALNLVKEQKNKEGIKNIIIVEGQMDVIAMHRAGFSNTVACMGTALTKEHIKQLKRFSSNIVLCFDGDSAGVKATLRGIDIFAEFEDIDLKIACMPNGKDPDECIKELGISKVQHIIEKAITPTEFKIKDELNKNNINEIDGKRKFLKECLKIINALKSKSEQDLYLTKIRDLTNIPLDTLRRDVSTYEPETQNKESVIINDVENANHRAEKFVVASLLFEKSYAKFDENKISYIKNPTFRELLRYMFERKRQNKKMYISGIFDEFDVENEPLINEIISFDFEKVGESEKYFSECLWSIKENFLKNRQAELIDKFKTSQDINERKEIASEITKVTNTLKNKIVEEN